MSNTPKQSPLGVNVQGALLNNLGLAINSVAASYMGTSKTNSDYTFGKLVQDTVLRLQTLAINDAYQRNLVTRTSDTDTYDNLINIGSTTIPALGNAKPPTYIVEDPAGVWTTQAENYAAQKSVSPALPGPANSGYALTSNQNEGQQATWLPYTGVSADNPNTGISQWGYIRLHALQAWNEFNWNGSDVDWSSPEYKEFLSSFMTGESFVATSNKNIFPMYNSKTFLQGVYSNMNDLIAADITGVSLSTREFGNDLINLGNAIDLSTIDSFGMPSNLLQVLYKNSALNQDLVLALLASGITGEEITAIATGEQTEITLKTQQIIYGSLLLITGDSLKDTLAVLNCKTKNITNLAQLLSVKKLFPTSYQTLTVPVYNTTSSAANSKVYYLIYQDGAVNSQLTAPAVVDQVGIQSPISVYVINENTDGNINELAQGFGSYLYNIIPQADAIAAGAFAYSMQQIKNIKNCSFPVFAQVVKSTETVFGLSLVNGTNVPVDQASADAALAQVALGSGIYGTYTLSDLFGSMSGLPYPWQQIYQKITDLQTAKLRNIYRENFLAVTWQGAAVTVQYSTGPGPTYTVTGVTLTNPGGGYGRGGAPAPTITISGGSGATATCTIGTDDTDAGSNGTGTFGRVTSVTLTSAGSPSATIPTITIEYPPTDTLAVQTSGLPATGGSNTASGTVGWPATMNTVVQAYINQANTEIAAVLTNNPVTGTILNNYWNLCGAQLTREQRTRYTAFIPVTVIEPDSTTIIRKDYFTSLYPSTQYTFLDSIEEYAQDTKPHMAAQTLEAIANLQTVGGQSLVALMREIRNRTKLLEAGIEQDNTVPDDLTATQTKQLITNGSIPDPATGKCTPPALLVTIDPITREPVFPVPTGVVRDGIYRAASAVLPGSTNADITDCSNVVNTVIPVGPEQEVGISDPYIIAAPLQVNPVVPENLNTDYTSSTLLPANIPIQQAIDQVIECNCDCWVN